MNKSKISFYALLLIIGVLNVTCNNSIFTGKIKEGTLVYEISYLDDESENPLISLLPKEMTIKFKNNNTISYIEGFFGTFKLMYITDYESGKNSSVLRILDKKYIYSADTSQLPAGYNDMENIKITKLDSTVNIIGYKCKVARCYCPAISKDDLMIYYTYDIKIKNPNSNNPFKDIDGVLMGFQVKLAGINMKFIAKEVIKEEVSDSEFVAPEGFKSVSKSELEEVLKSFQEKE